MPLKTKLLLIKVNAIAFIRRPVSFFFFKCAEWNIGESTYYWHMQHKIIDLFLFWPGIQNPSLSCHAMCTDIPDPLSPALPIVYCFQQVFRATSRIDTGSSWLSCLCSSMWRGPLEYTTYEPVPTSPTVSCTSSSKFDSFHDGWFVAVQLLFCGMLPQGLVQYCSQHCCVIAVKLFLHTLC